METSSLNKKNVCFDKKKKKKKKTYKFEKNEYFDELTRLKT